MTAIEPARLDRSYLPVIDRPLDNTALSAYMTCPREYYLGMIQHRRSKGKSTALIFGAVWHKILEMHYRGAPRDLVIFAAEQEWIKEGGPEAAAADYRTLNRAILEYDKYLKTYGTPEEEAKAGHGTTVGSGADAIVEMPTNAQGDLLLHPWAGKLDRIVEVGGLYYIEDHKTTSRFDKNYFRQYELSNQMMGYTYLGKQIFPSLNVVGVRINLLHCLTDKSQFLRQNFTFSPAQIDEWAKNNNVWMRRLARDYEILQELESSGDFTFEKAITQAFPGHYGDNGCSRKFGMCGYHQVCSSSPRARQYVLESEFEIRPWNPLEADE